MNRIKLMTADETSLKYEIAPAHTVRIGDKLCEADGYSFEVVRIEEGAGRKHAHLAFVFAPQNGIGPDVRRSGWIGLARNVRIFRGDK